MIQSLADGHVVWKPLPKQAVALACPAKEVLYGGEKGSAKTHFLVACVGPLLAFAHRKYVATGIKQHKVRILVFRKNLNDLEDFTVKTYDIYPYLDPKAEWHSKEKYWEFESGATVEIHHLDDPLAHESFNGNEITTLLFDEVQYIPYVAYAFLVAQLRSGDPDYKPFLIVRATANPGGPHGDWVKRHWQIEEFPDGGRIFEIEVTNKDKSKHVVTRAFVRAKLSDNRYLNEDGEYEAHLRSIWGPDEIKMYLEGDFNCTAGAFFSNLLKLDVHFVKSHPIPGTWNMMHSTDWGSTSPSCTEIGACDNDNRVWIIDELHRPGISGSTYGEAMKTLLWGQQKWSRERVWSTDAFWGVIDTQAMDRHNGPATPASGIMEHGFRLFPADKGPGQRADGINQIKERLLLDRLGRSQLTIFEDRCPHLTRALKNIQSCAPIDPDDYDFKSPYAHATDALRFMLMKWLVRSVLEEHPQDAEVARWNRVLSRQREVASESGDRVTGGYGD